MLYIRKNHRDTAEYQFLTKFLDSGYFNKYNQGDYNITLIQEPFTEVGYADLVCVRWRKNINIKWNEQRRNIVKNDIKVLHHLYNCKKFKSSTDIVADLGFSHRQVDKILFNLSEADLIIENKNRDKVKARNVNDIFLIKDIVAIEAKLRDWKGALRQSINNMSFASHSISLLPESTINGNLLKHYKKTEIGVLSFGDKYRQVLKPKRMPIPANITSWYFNEYIGRTACLTC